MTTTTATTNSHTFTISAKLSASGVQFPNAGQNSQTRHNKFRVTIKHADRRTSFNFYDSDHHYRGGHTKLTPSELIFAFYCFLSDSMAADESFAGFCSIFGYDTDSRRAFAIYKQCDKSRKKLADLCPNADVYGIIDELTEKYDF